MSNVIPVVIFAYARPAHLARVLDCLRENQVPLLYAFADGGKGDDAKAVSESRALLRAVTWTEVRLTERSENFGLGRNVMAGVDEIAKKHDAFIVWEDDLVCVPGTYDWMCAGLREFSGDMRVMSITGWTHPRITPAGIGIRPYFDGRAECWVWGTWRRAWNGMCGATAFEKLAIARSHGVRVDEYGSDLPLMAVQERQKNLWAVRWLYHHLEHGGLCVRPPWSMVEHIGFDASATNAAVAGGWDNPPLRPVPPIPQDWPIPVEHPECRLLWRAAYPGRWRRRWSRGCGIVSKLWGRPAQFVIPDRIRRWCRLRSGWKWYRGQFSNWKDARRASAGYDDAAVLTRVVAATAEVQAGRALWERDGTLFNVPASNAPLLAALVAAAGTNGRLTVIDFGGALGSVWRQHRAALKGLGEVRWKVVEQPHYVDAGIKFSEAGLSFHRSIGGAAEDPANEVLLLSSVLQYIEKPTELLAEAVRLGFGQIVVDRTPFVRKGPTRLTVQQTPVELGGGSYPSWIFSRDELFSVLSVDYGVTSEWPALDKLSPEVQHLGFHLYRR